MAIILLGGIIRLFANLWGQNGTWEILDIGHLIIGIGVVYLTFVSLKYIIHSEKHFRTWLLSSSFLCSIPFGYLLSFLIA